MTKQSINEKLIHRTITFTEENFGALQRFKRTYRQSFGIDLTNSEALAQIMHEHRLLNIPSKVVDAVQDIVIQQAREALGQQGVEVQ